MLVAWGIASCSGKRRPNSRKPTRSSAKAVSASPKRPTIDDTNLSERCLFWKSFRPIGASKVFRRDLDGSRFSCCFRVLREVLALGEFTSPPQRASPQLRARLCGGFQHKRQPSQLETNAATDGMRSTGRRSGKQLSQTLFGEREGVWVT